MSAKTVAKIARQNCSRAFWKGCFLPRHWERSPQAFQLLPPQFTGTTKHMSSKRFVSGWKSSQLNYVFTRPMIRGLQQTWLCNDFKKSSKSKNEWLWFCIFAVYLLLPSPKKPMYPLPLNWDEPTKLLLDPQICQHCLRGKPPGPSAPASFNVSSLGRNHEKSHVLVEENLFLLLMDPPSKVWLQIGTKLFAPLCSWDCHRLQVAIDRWLDK